MKQLIIILLLLVSVNAFSQASIDSVLARIEHNNTTLSALYKNMEADKTGNKTGIWLSNPEVEFNYLWGNPSAIGNRTDFAVSQSFDFPTAYAYRHQISELKNDQAGLEYQKQRLEILHQARLVCGQLTFQNARLTEYYKRVKNAGVMAGIYQKKLDAGETGILEYNKTQISLLNLSKELETIEMERQTLLDELARLNGGMALAFSDTAFTMPPVLPGFEQWYAQVETMNPMLQWLKQDLTLTQKQKQLQAAQNLPKFSAGYMSEKVVGEQFQGVMLGVSIPLWENRNTIKRSKARVLAVEEMYADAKLQYYNQMKTQFNKVIALQNSVAGYRKSIEQFNNRELSRKALEKGELSLADYYIELSFYYESIDRLLEMERKANLAYYELLRFSKL